MNRFLLLITLLLVFLTGASFACTVTEFTVDQNNFSGNALLHQPFLLEVSLSSDCVGTLIVSEVNRIDSEDITQLYAEAITSRRVSIPWSPTLVGPRRLVAEVIENTPRAAAFSLLSEVSLPAISQKIDVGVYAISSVMYISFAGHRPGFFEYDDFNIMVNTFNATSKDFGVVPLIVSFDNNNLHFIDSYNGLNTPAQTIAMPPYALLFLPWWTNTALPSNSVVSVTIGYGVDLQTTGPRTVQSRPYITLQSPLESFTGTDVNFVYSVTNQTDVNYCSLSIDGNIRATTSTAPFASFSQTLSFAEHTWGVTCTTVTDANKKAKYNNVTFANEGGAQTILVSPFVGAGTTQNPFKISTCADLNNISLFIDKTYVLTQDINCAGFAWKSLGSCIEFPRSDRCGGAFTGVLDGNNYTIANLSSTTGGLFKYVSEPALIKNISFTNATLSGDEIGVVANGLYDGAVLDNVRVFSSYLQGGYETGCIVGALASGHIRNSRCVNSVISGPQNVGGIAGVMAGGHVGGGVPSLKNSFVLDSNVLGTSQSNSWLSVGGLIGWRIRGDVNASLARAFMDPSQSVGSIGGLIGKSSNPTYDSITASYWDLNSSRVPTSAGGEGLITDALTPLLTALS